MKFIIVIIILGFVSLNIYAKPYQLKWGQEYLSISYKTMTSKKIYDKDGAKQSLPGHITKRTTTVRYERGFPKDWNLILEIPYIRNNDNFSGQKDQQQLGDIYIAGRFLQKKYERTDNFIKAAFKFKGSDYNENQFNSPGDGNTDFTLSYISKKTLEKAEIIGELGFRWRSKWPGNEFPFNLKINYKLSEKFKLKFFYDSVNSLTGHDYDPNDLRENEEDKNTAGIGFDINLKNNRIIYFSYSETVNGKNTYIDKGYKIGTGFWW